MRRAIRAAGSVVFALGLVAACTVGDVDVSNKACPCADGYTCDATRNVCVKGADAGLASDGDVDGAPTGTVCDDCPCQGDPDCKDPQRPRCSPETKRCVECVAAPDTCPVGSYCNEKSQCTLGCKQETDCQISPSAPHCASERHQCVECTAPEHCTGGKICSPSGACVDGCDLSVGRLCEGGKECCNKFCIDTKVDPLNCGACGTTCNDSNATPRCAAGTCEWTCANGFAHCDVGNTGCETNTRTDVNRCGSCTKSCSAQVIKNATKLVCSAAVCGFEGCTAGHGDCDGNAANGCECDCGAAVDQPCCPGDVCAAPLRCNVGQKRCR
jgi:hypothetical protein